MKLIIAGSREFKDYNYLSSKLDELLVNVTEEIEVVCGVCRGVDLLGKQYAEEKGWVVKTFPPDWNGLGKKAGPVRNRQMAEYADALVAFDAGGEGTKNMIELAKQYGLKIRVVKLSAAK